jgi:PHD/YefM family antitoxin component YafN of YafNO toxin-antitoxin module
MENSGTTINMMYVLRNSEIVGVTMAAKEELIEIPKKEYEAMKETLEILSDVKTAVRILKSIEQAEAGETISEKEFVRKFAL